MTEESHTFMDGRLHVYKREGRFWQCSTYLGGRNHRSSTKQENLLLAKEFATQWYLERSVEDQRRKRGEMLDGTVQLLTGTGVSPTDGRRRRTSTGPTFKEAAEAFEAEYQILTQGERNKDYVDQKSRQIRVHLLPFFGDKKVVADITSDDVQAYRIHRQTSRKDPKTGEPKRPARPTLHSEMVTLRQILKTAKRKGWITGIPDMEAPYKSSGKISHRAWFTPAEYTILYEAARERAKNPKKERWRKACEDMLDYILIMGNTGLRPDEILRVEDRDVTIVDDDATRKRILEIEVRGKRGTGICKSMPGAVHPFERLKERKKLKPTDRLFPRFQRELFAALLQELDLKHDREGQVRTAYSLRHTYICMRLLEGADVYQLAKNCRTSVEMIEKYYASHLKNMIDTSAINVRKRKAVNSNRKPKLQSERPKRGAAA